MRKCLWMIVVVLAITAGCAGYYSSPEAGYPPGGGTYGDPSVQTYSGGPQQYGPNEESSYFYDRLSPYGNWVNILTERHKQDNQQVKKAVQPAKKEKKAPPEKKKKIN